MKNKSLTAIALVLLAALLLCACAASSPAKDTARAAPAAEAEAGFGWEMEADVADEYAAAPAAPAEAPQAAPGAAASPPSLTLPQDERKIIMTAWVSMESLVFDETCQTLKQAADESGGYISYTDLSGNAEAGDRYAHFTIRVPAENYAAFMQKMDAAGNVVSRSEQAQDVTDQFVDLEARLNSLRLQESRLLAMMQETARLADIIEVQNQLAEVQYQIESYEGSRRSLDSLVSYSTVDVTISEVKEATTVGEQSYGEEIAEAFRESWRTAGRFLQDLGVGLVWLVPVLLMLIIVAIPVLIIVFFAVRAARKRRAKRAKAAPAAPAPQAWAPAAPHPAQQQGPQSPAALHAAPAPQGKPAEAPGEAVEDSAENSKE